MYQSAPNSLVISSDSRLCAQLEAYLRDDHGCLVDLATNFQDGERKLQAGQLASVFVDLRQHSDEHDPSGLLWQLACRPGWNVPVIAIADGGYRSEWAAAADWAVAGRLDLPLDRQKLANLVQTAVVGGVGLPTVGPANPRVLAGQSVRFTTYTPELFPLLDQLEVVSAHDVTLLLVGETGSGKTTLARVMHELSIRRDERFLTVACGALPQDLIESELFGHVKGAFTGADRTTVGRFEAAERGTLLLDEIDVLGPKEQSKLLRVIETGEFEAVGSTETRHTEARLIVASNVDLKSLMARNEFRADLYYRLNVLEFPIPPLRRRPLDIVPMALEFVQEFSSRHQIAISRIHPEFLEMLKLYDWPGNLRELKNQMRRAVLFCHRNELSPRELSPHIVQSVKAGERPEGRPAVASRRLADKMAFSEQEVLGNALRAHNYKRTATAEALGLSRVGLYKKMKKYGLLDLGGKKRSRLTQGRESV